MIRRSLLSALALSMVFAMSSCSVPSAEPTPEDTFMPVVSAPVKMATILIPNTIPSAMRFDDTVERLNSAVKAAGQNVEFKLQAVTYSSLGNSFVEKARQEMAAGNPSATAYALSIDVSTAFFRENLTMDVTELVRQNASIYYSKHSGIFGDILTGIPVGIYSQPVCFKTALMLRSDIAPGRVIGTTEELFKLMDELAVKSENKLTVLADPEHLVSQWALEKGFYSLRLFGVDGYLYAALNDKQCTPVPLEKISGLDAFMTEMKSYYKTGMLSGEFYEVYSRETAGFVKNIGDYYVSNPFTWLSWIPGDFFAQYLSPEQPSVFSEPSYVEELAIPAACPPAEAAEVARFVEWYNASQENYDTVLYGGQGVDFVSEGARFAPMREGKRLNMKNIMEMQGLFFTWPGATVLSNTDYYRLPASAPANVEELYEKGLSLRTTMMYEANSFLKADTKTMVEMEKLSEGMADICRARNDAINNLIYATPYAYTDYYYTRCLESLEKLATDRLVDDYKRIIDKIRNN